MVSYDELWFGSYGGCFISDAFTLGCDRYHEQFKQLVSDEGFQAEFEALKARFAPFLAVMGAAGAEPGVEVCRVPRNADALIGTALVGARLEKQVAHMGARYADEALLAAFVCRELELPLHLFLSKEVGSISSLTEQLSLLGVDVDVKMCAEIFDLPEMYAFQAWVSDADRAHLINARCNCGAFPQANIALAFCRGYGEQVLAAAEGAKRLVVPVTSGSTAAGIVAALPRDASLEIVCVECDTSEDMVQELDSYCGAFTKVMRNRLEDRVIAPYLAYAEDEGVVSRVAVAPEDVDFSLMAEQPLSLQSRAALTWASAHPAEGRTVVVVSDARWGTIV